MKHIWYVTLVMLGLFVLTQLVGLLVVYNYIDWLKTESSGEATFNELDLSGYQLERPDVDESWAWVYMTVAVLIGALLLLTIIKFRFTSLWKVWFAVAITLCLALSLSAFMNSGLALVIAILLTYFRIFRPNVFVQNLSEVFLYGGLAAIFVPIMNIFSAFALLFAISIYDMYAVWKSKHMIKMAVFQSEQKMFAGLFVPYKTEQTVSIKTQSAKLQHPKKSLKSLKLSKPNSLPKPPKFHSRTAILGGGDVGFPLLFAGTVLKSTLSFWHAALIIPFTTLSLALLFYLGEKDKFYPAMPFVTLGCIVGYLVVLLV